MVRISEEKFVKQHYIETISSPLKTEFRQFHPSIDIDGNQLMSSYLFYEKNGRAGVVLMSDYWSSKIHYFEFAWEYKHPCPLTADSKWQMNTQSSNPGRGIRDYSRKLVFQRDLNTQELQDVRYWLETDDCPGYTGVFISHIAPGQYSATTTWDSSD